MGQPLRTCSGHPHADAVPSPENYALAGGVEHDAAAAVAVAERGVSGEYQAGIRMQDRWGCIAVDGHGADGRVGEEGDLNRQLLGCSAEGACFAAGEAGLSQIPRGVVRKQGPGASGLGVSQEKMAC